MRRLPLLIASVSLVCLSAPTARASVTSDDFGPVPAAAQIAYVAMSPDCGSVAVAVKTENGVELRINGKPRAAADEIPFVLYSADGGRLAYTARKGKAWYIVLNGVEAGTGPQGAAWAAFSADSRHFAYVGASPTGMMLVVDGTAPAQQFHEIRDVVMTPDGDHIAFAVNDSTGWFVIVDGKRVGATYPLAIGRIILSQDGRRVAFVGVLSRDAGVASRYEVDIDGKPYGPYYDILSGPTFGPDSKTYFGAEKATGPAVQVRGRPVFPLADPEVIDGKEYADPEAADQKLWSSDGRHVIDAYHGAMPNGGWVDDLSLDGKPLDRMPYNLTLSPDGLRVASVESDVTRDKRWSVYGGGLDGPGYANVGPPLFSRDGMHLAYAAQNDEDGNWSMVLDQSEDRTGALVCPTADLDASGKWNPTTKFEDQKSIDNGSSYPGQLPYHFDPDGTLVYFRIEGGHLYRVHWKPDDATTLPATRP
jgi:hypothetical protein